MLTPPRISARVVGRQAACGGFEPGYVASPVGFEHGDPIRGSHSAPFFAWKTSHSLPSTADDFVRPGNATNCETFGRPRNPVTRSLYLPMLSGLTPINLVKLKLRQVSMNGAC
ncbi:hypothetical protein BC2230_21169 [Burkholderia cepacia]